MRLQSKLWAVLHTLISTVCESKYARLRIIYLQYIDLYCNHKFTKLVMLVNFISHFENARKVITCFYKRASVSTAPFEINIIHYCVRGWTLSNHLETLDEEVTGGES